MKVLIFIILMFSCFSCRTDHPEEDKTVAQAEKLMLSDPKKSFDLAHNLLKEHSLAHNNKVRSLFVLTNTSNILGNPLDVIKYGNLTLESATEEGDVITKIKALTLLGNTYQSIQLNEKLRTNLDQAEQLLSSPAVPDSMNIIRGNIFYLKAMNYFSSMDGNIALSYFDKAIHQYLLSKEPVAKINLTFAYTNKGWALIDQKRFDLAKQNFALARVDPQSSPNRYPPLFVERMETTSALAEAKMYAVQNDPDRSNAILFGILNDQKNIQVKKEIENDIYKLLADNFLKKNDVAKHDYYQNLYISRASKYNQIAAELVNKLIQQEGEAYAIKKKEIDRSTFY
ncbi:hypothetical protein QE422_001632 [Chryseobacterium sp. SORGH_AS 447]|uniref:hypothetical protein n=1 Tax=Chryseobacterium sp. SORGH_AS_0447 TaxID=3041769 RepID=UPI00278B073C|nr:hypothetical protein [Chryseobacterium sp. SORGH_AS_0447]MDQ1161264.1 hypothetical protein [Chryseobacterium sp. SORGH_AS_0447]